MEKRINYKVRKGRKHGEKEAEVKQTPKWIEAINKENSSISGVNYWRENFNWEFSNFVRILLIFSKVCNNFNK